MGGNGVHFGVPHLLLEIEKNCILAARRWALTPPQDQGKPQGQ